MFYEQEKLVDNAARPSLRLTWTIMKHECVEEELFERYV